MQAQAELTNHNIELLTEQIGIMKQQRMGHSSEKIEPLDGQQTRIQITQKMSKDFVENCRLTNI